MELHGRPDEIVRLANSKDGNPRFRVTIHGRSYNTAINTGDAYAITTTDAGSLVDITVDGNFEIVNYKRIIDSRCETCGDLRYRCVGH